MTGDGFRGEVKDLTQLIKRHEEYQIQIRRQIDKSEIVKDEGRHLIQEGNFMSKEVELRSHHVEIVTVLLYSMTDKQASKIYIS